MLTASFSYHQQKLWELNQFRKDALKESQGFCPPNLLCMRLKSHPYSFCPPDLCYLRLKESPLVFPSDLSCMSLKELLVFYSPWPVM
jgi:hypothetical protein